VQQQSKLVVTGAGTTPLSPQHLQECLLKGSGSSASAAGVHAPSQAAKGWWFGAAGVDGVEWLGKGAAEALMYAKVAVRLPERS